MLYFRPDALVDVVASGPKGPDSSILGRDKQKRQAARLGLVTVVSVVRARRSRWQFTVELTTM